MPGSKSALFSYQLVLLASLWLVVRHQTLFPLTPLIQFITISLSWTFSVILIVCWKTWSRRARSPLKDLPGPKSVNWLYDHTFDIFDEPLAYNVTDWINSQSYPDGLMHFFGLFGSDYVVPTDHEGLIDVLSKHSYDFEKTKSFRKYVIRFFGNGLVSQEQEQHRAHRKLFTPVLNQAAIKPYRPMVTAKCSQFVKHIISLCEVADQGTKDGHNRQSVVTEFTDLSKSVAMDAAGVLAVGKDYETIQGKNQHILDALNSIFMSSSHRKTRFFWHNILPRYVDKLIPSAEEDEMDKAHELLETLMNDEAMDISRNLEKGGSENKNFLTSLISSGVFGEPEHLAHAVTILAAGYISAGGSLSYVLYCLAANQSAQRMVRDEIIATKGARPCLDEDEYDKLPLLNAMIMESLRLFPSFPLLLRKAIRDTSIKGRPIARGTYVAICPRAINHSRHLWGRDAEQFSLERWVDRSDPPNPKILPTGSAAHSVSMLTFGYGTRSCVGQNLALALIKRVVALLVERIRVERVDDRVPHPVGVFATTPPPDMKLRFTRLTEEST